MMTHRDITDGLQFLLYLGTVLAAMLLGAP